VTRRATHPHSTKPRDSGTLVSALTAARLTDLPIDRIHRLVRERSVRTETVRSRTYLVPADLDRLTQAGRPG
jgi:hypothetical protein